VRRCADRLGSPRKQMDHWYDLVHLGGDQLRREGDGYPRYRVCR
jgi:hypothetical protein